MHFAVTHETLYRYSGPVMLSGHSLRLTPRAGQGRLLRHEIEIDPEPVFREDVLDAWGNPLTRLDFRGDTEHLRIQSRFEIDTATPISRPLTLPALPWGGLPAGLAPGYLGASGVPQAVRDFAEFLAGESGWLAPRFLARLNRTLFERTDRHIRPDGDAQSPEVTLATAQGACRDLSVLFIAICRCFNIPARFVSGYQARSESPDGRRHLHAWPEAYLPGLGWRGFDPTHGTEVGDGYVALCVAPGQAGTMPVEGGFYGTGIRSTLSYTVEIAAEAD